MIKMKLGQVSQVIQSINVITTQRMGSKLSFDIYKMVKKLGNELDLLEKVRTELCEKLCNKDENGKAIMIPILDENGKETKQTRYSLTPKATEEVQKELSELVNTDVEINMNPIKIDALEKAGVQLSAKDIMLLEPIIDQEDESELAPVIELVPDPAPELN